jgi:hypothetical protein
MVTRIREGVQRADGPVVSDAGEVGFRDAVDCQERREDGEGKPPPRGHDAERDAQ